MHRIALIMFLVLSARAIDAASYQKKDGTTVDPIQAATGGPLPYAGNNLEPNASLKHAVLSGAILIDADLTGADLISASLDGADLQSADLSTAELDKADFSDAILTGADLNTAYLDEAVMELSLIHI